MSVRAFSYLRQYTKKDNNKYKSEKLTDGPAHAPVDKLHLGSGGHTVDLVLARDVEGDVVELVVHSAVPVPGREAKVGIRRILGPSSGMGFMDWMDECLFYYRKKYNNLKSEGKQKTKMKS